MLENLTDHPFALKRLAMESGKQSWQENPAGAYNSQRVTSSYNIILPHPPSSPSSPLFNSMESVNILIKKRFHSFLDITFPVFLQYSSILPQQQASLAFLLQNWNNIHFSSSDAYFVLYMAEY